MSQANVEVVHRAYAAFNRGDVDSAFNDFAPDFECDMSRALGVNLDRDLYDLVQFRAVFAEYVASWESFHLGGDEFLDAGEDVVVTFTNRARGRDGIELQARGSMVWTVRDGAIVKACLYQEREEALKAAGLSR